MTALFWGAVGHGELIIELDLLRAFFSPADKFGRSLGEFETYIRNNIEFIPNFGGTLPSGRNHQKRFVKKQKMQRTPQGAHLVKLVEINTAPSLRRIPSLSDSILLRHGAADLQGGPLFNEADFITIAELKEIRPKIKQKI